MFSVILLKTNACIIDLCLLLHSDLMALRAVFLLSVYAEFSHAKTSYTVLDFEITGCPSCSLSLAMQGVFRGLKDTKTPLYATSNLTFSFPFSCSFHQGIWSLVQLQPL